MVRDHVNVDANTNVSSTYNRSGSMPFLEIDSPILASSGSGLFRMTVEYGRDHDSVGER